MNTSSRDRPGETEQDVTIRRLDRERFWMLGLATLYPYGLIDYNMSETFQKINSLLHSTND